MASIQPMQIKITDIIRGDMLDVSFNVTHNLADLSGKTLYAEVRREQDSPIVLSFAELDNTLNYATITATEFTIAFIQPASVMEAISPALYRISVIMGTAPNYEDKQTIIEGTFQVVTEITKKPI